MHRLSIALLTFSIASCGPSADLTDETMSATTESLASDSRDREAWSEELAEVDRRLAGDDVEEPVRYELLTYRGVILMRLADIDWQQAIEEYDRCLEGWPSSGAGTETCVGPEPDHTAAVAAFEDVLAAYPDGHRNDEILLYLGQLALEARDGDSGMLHLTRLIDDFPDSSFRPQACLAAGDYYFDQARALAAERAYQCAIEGGSEDVRLYATYKLAWLDYNFQRFESANERLQQVVEASRELNPELQRQAIQDLVLFYADLPDGPSRAATELPPLLADDARAALLLERLADLLAERGDVAECQQVLSDLVTTYPESARRPRWESRLAGAECRHP